MKGKLLSMASKTFVILCMLSVAYVALLSLFDPRATMALVQVELGNTDALSSIRGVYGGLGLIICALLIYLFVVDIKRALLYLGLFWAAYALSRLLTIALDGPLGAFGQQWLIIESLFALLALMLWKAQRPTPVA